MTAPRPQEAYRGLRSGLRWRHCLPSTGGLRQLLQARADTARVAAKNAS